jgi:hypothetical protein
MADELRIRNINANIMNTFSAGSNHMSDWTQEEFDSLFKA